MSRMYSQADGQAFEQAEQEAAARGYVLDKHNGEFVVAYFEKNVTTTITVASVTAAINQMRDKGLLHWKSQAQMNFEEASQGLSAQQLATLSSGLDQYHLIADQSEEGLQNKVTMLGYLKGRSIDHPTIFTGASFLQNKGVQLYWKPAPVNQTPHRGHNAGKAPTPQDMVWISKEDANRAHVGKINHSSDPRFNGEKERQEKHEQERRFGGGTTQSVKTLRSLRKCGNRKSMNSVEKPTQRRNASRP